MATNQLLARSDAAFNPTVRVIDYLGAPFALIGTWSVRLYPQIPTANPAVPFVTGTIANGKIASIVGNIMNLAFTAADMAGLGSQYLTMELFRTDTLSALGAFEFRCAAVGEAMATDLAGTVTIQFGSVIVQLAQPSSLKGDPGIGVPPGGAAGQVLTKNSATDYDTVWAVGGGGTNLFFCNAAQLPSSENVSVTGTGIPALSTTPFFIDIQAPFTNTGSVNISFDAGVTLVPLVSPSGNPLQANEFIQTASYQIKVTGGGSPQARIKYSGATW